MTRGLILKITVFAVTIVCLLVLSFYLWFVFARYDASEVHKNINYDVNAAFFHVQTETQAQLPKLKPQARSPKQLLADLVVPAIKKEPILRHFNVQVFEHNKRIYDFKYHPMVDAQYIVDTELRINGAVWQFKFAPSIQYVERLHSVFPLLGFLAALAVTFTIAILFLLLVLAQLKAVQFYRNARELKLLYAGFKSMLGAQTLDEGILALLKSIGENINWPIGHAYVYDKDEQTLVSSNLWYIEPTRKKELESFRMLTKHTKFRRGIGLPGWVWESHNPRWIDDIYKEPGFLRKVFSDNVNLHNAFAFPIFNEKNEIHFVLEFFSNKTMQPEASFLKLINLISDQANHIIAQFTSEKSAEENEKKYRGVIEYAVDAIIMIDTEGVIHECNRVAHEIFGYAPNSLLGKQAQILLPKRSLLKHEEQVKRHLKTSEKRLIGQMREVVVKNKSGDEFPIELSVSEMKFQDTIYFIGFMRDITVTKKNQELLQESRDRMALVLRSAGEGVYGLDLKGNVTFINEAALVMLGYTQKEVLGTKIRSLERCARHEDRVSSADAAIDLEPELCWRKDGSSFFVEYTRSDAMQDDKVIGAVVVFKDVTKEKYQREVINFNNAMMDKLVELQDDYIAGEDIRTLFDKVLTTLFDLTGSRMGFIAAIDSSNSRPHLRLYTLLNIDWPNEVRKQYEKKLATGVEFTEFLDLFANVINKGEIALVNAKVKFDKKKYRIGRHVGIPVFSQKKLVGMIGIANKATDYDKDMPNLIRPIVKAVASMIESSAASKKLEEMAYHDFLTGLYNPSFVAKALGYAIFDAEKHHTLCAVLLLDLGAFKKINDQYGHHFGDLMLSYVARRLTDICDPKDVIARLINDKFVVLMKSVLSTHDAGLYARKIAEAFNLPMRIQGEDLRVAVSIGIACYPIAGITQDALMDHVQQALNKAKSSKTMKYAYYDPRVQNEHERRLKIEEGVENALANHEFRLVYQPQYHLAQSLIVGMEALLRWNIAEIGEVSADEFIHILENAKKMKEVGQWVLETALKDFSKIQEKVAKDFVLSINLSAQQLVDRKIVDAIMTLMKKYHIKVQHIAFEVTETSLVENSAMEPMLRQLKKIGFSIAIDDFGTGYSSLSRLKDLPIDTLKIDKSFVLGSTVSKELRVIIENTVALAKNLNLHLIAEGVETKQNVTFLLEKECPYGQGFYLSKPLSLEEVKKLLF
jgi:diguanylate cyclase (GGDEF)-like protein/PAS domain S-box-containing protein